MTKLIKSQAAAKAALLEGAKKLNDAVSETLGPLGNNVTIDMKWTSPKVVHDGVTVAKEVILDDPFENMGAKLIREAAGKTNDSTGDGTTTATILSYALLSEGMKQLENGVRPMRLRKEINDAGKQALDFIISQAKKLDTPEEIKQIATISAQDELIGSKVAEALAKVGIDGVITVEEGTTNEIVIDYKEGMQFEKGLISPYFATDPDRMIAEITNPRIIVTDHTITQTSEIMGIIDAIIQDSKDIVIIAADIVGDALLAVIAQKLRGLRILAIKAPAYGSNRLDLLEDISRLTGATLIDQIQRKLTSITSADFGKATKVIVDADSSTIVGATGDVDKRVAELKSKLKTATSEFDKERLQGRIAKLISGAAIIQVGGMTESEISEKKERVIDAVAATKAAIAEGVVPGGQTLLLKAVIEGDGAGYDVVRRALTKPFFKLIENSDLDYIESLDKVIDSPAGFGIDVMDGQVKDLVKAGIIDPVKVLRCALENAISVAGSMLTTTVLITEKEEKKLED